MLMLHSLTALTVDTAGVEYPVVGTPIKLTCKTEITGATKYEWYKGVTKLAETGKSLTIPGDIANDGDYKCIAFDANSNKLDESPVTDIAFKSESFISNVIRDS